MPCQREAKTACSIINSFITNYICCFLEFLFATMPSYLSLFPTSTISLFCFVNELYKQDDLVSYRGKILSYCGHNWSFRIKEIQHYSLFASHHVNVTHIILYPKLSNEHDGRTDSLNHKQLDLNKYA